MTNKKIDYNELFKMFISKETNIPEIMHPYKQKGMYYATDLHSMIYMPVGDILLDYPEQDKPDSASIMLKGETTNFKINVSDFERKLIPQFIEEIIEEEISDECEECNGDGEVEFQYNGTKKDYTIKDTCPLCDGKGKIEKTNIIKTGKNISNPFKIYKMNSSYFLYKEFKRLIDACKIIGIENITQSYEDAKKANLFKCREINILIMPSYISSDDGVTIIY